MRNYGQYCSIARALDLVGDRWTLLIVRELLLQGPCRFTDLKNGLPGIATNLLSARLRELDAARRHRPLRPHRERPGAGTGVEGAWTLGTAIHDRRTAR